jgi:hypothetical protein
VVVMNFRFSIFHPPPGLGVRAQATSDAFAMSSPAARSTTTSIATASPYPYSGYKRWPARVGADRYE